MAKKEELTVVSTDPVELDAATTSKTTESAAETKDSKPAEVEAKKPESVKDETEEVPIDDDKPPPRPPRPASPVAQLTKTLKDAFPNIEDKYITTVIIASQGNLDSSFNALLYLSDPSFKPEINIQAPEKPQRPPNATDDELLARQLQKEFEKEDLRRRRRSEDKRRQRPKKVPEYEDESPDEFEQIKETFTQGIEDARTTLNGWVSGLSKKFSGEPEPARSSNANPQLFGALGGSSFKNNEVRSKTRFDEDPTIITNDFHDKINLKNNEEELPAPPVDEKASKKWQPLNSDVPINSDAFLVTDSEEEDDKKK